MRAAALLALVLSAASALAQPPKSVFVEDLTWTEVRDAIQAGKTTIIMPIGGTEQSGPHMALGKHNARVKQLAGRIATRLGDALVAPVVAYVPEGAGHMRFPGTITVPEAVFEALLESAARGFRSHGFRNIVFIGDHGGYRNTMKKAAASLNREWARTAARAHAIDEYYRAADEEFAELLKQKGFTSVEIGTHAGVADTSITLAIDPTLVRVERMKAAGMGKAEGVDGDPRRSSAELGKLGADLIVGKTVAAIRKATAPR